MTLSWNQLNHTVCRHFSGIYPLIKYVIKHQVCGGQEVNSTRGNRGEQGRCDVRFVALTVEELKEVLKEKVQGAIREPNFV